MILSIILAIILIIMIVLRVNFDYTIDTVNNEKIIIMWFGRGRRRFIKLFKV